MTLFDINGSSQDIEFFVLYLFFSLFHKIFINNSLLFLSIYITLSIFLSHALSFVSSFFSLARSLRLPPSLTQTHTLRHTYKHRQTNTHLLTYWYILCSSGESIHDRPVHNELLLAERPTRTPGVLHKGGHL